MSRWLGLVAVAFTLAACSSSTATTKKVTPANGAPAATTSGATATTKQDTYAVGDKVEIASGQTVQLYSIERPAKPKNDFIKPKAGNEYLALDTEVCAGPNVAADKTVNANPFDFKLAMPDNTRLDASFAAREPALHQTSLQANDCVRGWVTFEVAQGATVSQVLYNGRTPDMKQIIVKWNVPT